MPPLSEDHLSQALEGNRAAFQQQFLAFQGQLRSYLYRLLANRSEAEDLTHDTFLRAFDRLEQFQGRSSFKTWVFQIATHLAYNRLAQRKRWTEDVSAQAKELVRQDAGLARSIEALAQENPTEPYEIREHIDTCFTCIGKTLPIEQQIALMLKDVYGFSVREIEQILDKTEGVVKYLLQKARGTMTDIFARRCALVNKAGVCHQCSELNGWLNPRQNQQEALLKLQLVREAETGDQAHLYRLRTALIRHLDPLQTSGHALQELLLSCNRQAMGEG